MRCALYVTESLACAHGFYGDEIAAVVEAYDVRDVHDMEGKPCWVDLSDPGLIKWIGPCLIRP